MLPEPAASLPPPPGGADEAPLNDVDVETELMRRKLLREPSWGAGGGGAREIKYDGGVAGGGVMSSSGTMCGEGGEV